MVHHGRCRRKATKEHGDHRKAQQNISPLDLAIPAPSLDDALSTLDDLYSWTVSDRTAITCC